MHERICTGRRATASESSPTPCLQNHRQQVSIIRSEEHCVPEAGMQWHILFWHIGFSRKISYGVACHCVTVLCHATLCLASKMR